jgi:hypothetical protein
MTQEDPTIPSYSGLVPEFKPNNMPLGELQTYWRIFDNHCEKREKIYSSNLFVEIRDYDQGIQVLFKGESSILPVMYNSKGHNGHLRNIKVDTFFDAVNVTIEDMLFNVTNYIHKK